MECVLEPTKTPEVDITSHVHFTSAEATCYWLRNPDAAKAITDQKMALTPKVASYMYNYGVSIGKEQDYSCPEKKEPGDTTVVVDPKDQTEIVVEEPKKPDE